MLWVQVTVSFHLHDRGKQQVLLISAITETSSETDQWAPWAPPSTLLWHSSQAGKTLSTTSTGPLMVVNLKSFCLHWGLWTSLESTQSQAMAETQFKPWEETTVFVHIRLCTELESCYSWDKHSTSEKRSVAIISMLHKRSPLTWRGGRHCDGKWKKRKKIKGRFHIKKMNGNLQDCEYVGTKFIYWPLFRPPSAVYLNFFYLCLKIIISMSKTASV